MIFKSRKESSNKHSVIRLFGDSVIPKVRQGFTLIELLVVIAIIATLIGASVGAYSSMTRAAEQTRGQELVSNVATALTTLFQQQGAWPRRLLKNGSSDGELDADTAYALVAGDTKYMSLTAAGGKLTGLDRFGLVSPWATAVIKRRGTSASLSDVVGSGKTVRDHILHYALDLDGDGIIEGANVGGQSIDIRATAAVWCAGKDGVMDPYPYAGGGSGGKGANQSKTGHRSDDIYSWAPGQTKKVK